VNEKPDTSAGVKAGDVSSCVTMLQSVVQAIRLIRTSLIPQDLAVSGAGRLSWNVSVSVGYECAM
jgi:hypothetical protein